MQKNIFKIDLYYLQSFLSINSIDTITCNYNECICNTTKCRLMKSTSLQKAEYIINQAFKVLNNEKHLEIEEINIVQDIIEKYADIHRMIFFDFAA